MFTVADVLGEPVQNVVTGSELSSYVGSLPQGTALMIVVLLAVVVALLARTTTTPARRFGLLAMAGIALLPPPLTGHSASAANHAIATTGVALHVAAVAPWVGGLAVVGRPRGAAPRQAAGHGASGSAAWRCGASSPSASAAWSTSSPGCPTRSS